MNKLLLAVGLLTFVNVSFAKVCKPYLFHVTMPTGSQTLIHGCESNIPYRAIQVKYYKQHDILNSTQIMVDSRDSLDRARIEAGIAKIEDGLQTREFNRSFRQKVLSELKLALAASSEDEQNNHLTLATENLEALLIE